MTATNTQVAICNIALSRVRADTIDDINEDTPSAEQCRVFWDLALEQLLEMHPWVFANKTVALASTGVTPISWLYEYDYPSDCVQALQLVTPSAGREIIQSRYGLETFADFDPIPFQVVTGETSRLIHTDLDDAYLVYTKNITNLNLTSTTFRTCLAWLLAMDLAIPLGQDSGKKYRDDAEAGFIKSFGVAIAHSANQAETGRAKLPRNIQARISGASRLNPRRG